MIVVVMGVAGSGKTAVGRRLAREQGWAFVEGDDHHPARNVRKMAAGIALTDRDREPWLLSLRDVLAAHATAGESLVMTCSALKGSYRAILRAGATEVRFVFLRASRATLEHRLRARRGHFFVANLLDSQLETLEEPTDALVIDADQALDAVVDDVVAGLGLAPP